MRGFICEETYQVCQNINLPLEADDVYLSLEVEYVSLSLQEVGVCQLVTGGEEDVSLSLEEVGVGDLQVH